MQVLIVDEELLARNRLRVLLSECEDVTSPFAIEEAVTISQALTLMQRVSFNIDVMLLDTPMPGPEGAQLAQTLRTMSKPPAVVFVTSQSLYAASAFEVEAVDYLPKPVRLERLQQTLAKIRRMRNLAHQQAADEVAPSLVIRDRGRAERVPLHQIVYLKAEQKYVTVRTATRTYILDSSLSELETRFPNQFVRLHRNALVNPKQMRALEKHYTDEDGECWAMRLHSVAEVLQVSRRQLTSVRAALQNQLRNSANHQAQPA